MRRVISGLAAALAVVILAPSGQAQAQGIGGVDPFSLYYGYYLPHQAAIAATPTPMDTINQNIARNQFAAQTDRSSLYDPINPYGDEDDPLAPYSARKKNIRGVGAQGFTYGLGNTVSRGNGPTMYYNRTARYFPDLKIGRGPNRNLSVVRNSRGGGGMPAMPSMPSMPGPR
jgi:hypothetical protein